MIDLWLELKLLGLIEAAIGLVLGLLLIAVLVVREWLAVRRVRRWNRRADLLSLLVVVACEPCWSTPVHADRCEHGDDASCEWLLEHLDATTGACEVRR